MTEALFAMGSSALRAGSVVLLTALAATAAMRRSSASARHAVWVAALVGMAVAALLAAMPGDSWRGPISMDVPLIRVSAAGAGAAGSGAAVWWAGAVWLAVALLLLCALTISHGRVFLMARRAQDLHERRGGVRIVEAPGNCGPMTWGFFRPVIFLPREAATWESGVRDAVLKHELAHCERGDCWWLLLSRAVASVFWFQPLAWWAVYRIAAESERAADDAVLRTGLPAQGYAEWLLRIARSMNGEPSAALAMGRSSEFEGRLKSMLDGRMSRGTLGRTGALALAVAACLVLLPVAAAQKNNGDGKVYKIGGGVSAPNILSRVEPQYTEQARDAKLEGTVLMRLEIDKDGLPQDITVVRGLELGLSESAVAAVRQWKFKPGMKDGKPVRVLANIEVNFRLN